MHNDNSNFFNPPGSSLASRKVGLKSTASSRGFVPNLTCHRWAGYESKLERDFLVIALARPEVKLIQEQPAPVTYVDEEFKKRKHTFDFLIHLHSGQTIAYDIKPHSRRKKSGIDVVHDHIRQQHPGFADKLLIRTDREMPRYLVRNAELIHRSRALWDDDAISALKLHLMRMHGTHRFSDLVALLASSHEQASAFNAVLNLIYERKLKQVARGPIDDNTQLEISNVA